MGGADILSQGLSAFDAAKTLPELPGKADPAQVRRVAEDFESVFLGRMLQPMFEGLNSEPPFGGGHAEQVWRSLMVDEIGKSIAASGGVGLASQVQAAILQAQEAK